MIGWINRFIAGQQYRPGPAGIFVNPFFLARRELWREIARQGPALRGPLLDVGCGSKPYRVLFGDGEYVGLDIDSPESRRRATADVFYDGGRFPFEDGRFSAVLCNQVLEHVFNPEQFLGEIARVLASDGRLLLTVPFVWDEHEQPHDFARYSSFGLRALLERNGFQVIEQRKLLADSRVLFQLLNAYLFKVTRTRSKILNLLLTGLLMAPVTLLGLALGWLLPGNPDLFLDQLVLARKP